jgi:hypothetical protein
MIEDSLVIYRLSRAPERRIFYIDVGNLPKVKAEQYLRDVMMRYRNKLVYDASTGEIRDDKKFMSTLEDFWLPRREGGRGTEISTLPGGQNLGQMEDVQYFEKKLYKSLGVPVSRLEPQQGFSLGRTTEVTRDELKFSKFVHRLRSKFSGLFDDLLRVQLVFKRVCSEEEWKTFKEDVWYDFKKDNNFTELKESELLQNRLLVLQMLDPFVGRYFSVEYARRKVLMQTDEEYDEINQQMAAEAEVAQQQQAQAAAQAAAQGMTLDANGNMVPAPPGQPGQPMVGPNGEPLNPDGTPMLPSKFEVQNNEMEFMK